MNCPICTQQIEISDNNYGAMFTCPHCSGVYYINLSGEFELAYHEPVIEDPIIEQTFVSNQQIESNLQIDSASYQMNNTYTGSDDFNSQNYGAAKVMDQDLVAADNVYEDTQLTNPQYVRQDHSPLSEDSQMNSKNSDSDDNHLSSEMIQFSDSETNLQSLPSTEYLQPQESQVSMPDKNYSDDVQPSHTQENYNFDQPLDQVLQQSQNISDAIETTEISEDQNLGSQTGQWYQLKISGIDSSQIREFIEEALTDQKLQIDKEQLLSEITDGQMVINGLNAVKCAVIAQRLIYVDVQLDWSRHD